MKNRLLFKKGDYKCYHLGDEAETDYANVIVSAVIIPAKRQNVARYVDTKAAWSAIMKNAVFIRITLQIRTDATWEYPIRI